MAAEHRVCITFDFDAMSGLIARGMTTPSAVSRGEFGPVAVPRILALLERYRVKTTWFIPGHTLESYPEECAKVLHGDHEVGHHGWTHVNPVDMTLEEEEHELVRGNEQIVKLTGRRARGYRSPGGDLSRNSVDLLVKHGFVYESSMMGNDYMPYRVRRNDVIELQKPVQFGPATDLIELPFSWSLDDFVHFEFLRTKTSLMPGLMNASGVLENWINDFVYMQRNIEWGVLVYTFHPLCIGRGHRMLILEKLLSTLSEGGALFCTMEEAAKAYDQRHPVVSTKTAH